MQEQEIRTSDSRINGCRCLLNCEAAWLSYRGSARLFKDHEQIRFPASEIAVVTRVKLRTHNALTSSFLSEDNTYARTITGSDITLVLLMESQGVIIRVASICKNFLMIAQALLT